MKGINLIGVPKRRENKKKKSVLFKTIIKRIVVHKFFELFIDGSHACPVFPNQLLRDFVNK